MLTSGTSPHLYHKKTLVSIPPVCKISFELGGFVQFYLGTWFHRREVNPSHMEGQWSHVAA